MNSIDRGVPWKVGEGQAVYYGCMPAYPLEPGIGPWPSDGDPGPVPLPIKPLSPDEFAKMMAALTPILDEFAIMRALDKLDDAAKRRVQAWLNARCDMTPSAVPR
ncbi:MAG: hypothetical protein WC683_02315 [bacterium]